MGYEYGNARVASMRGRLLDRGTLTQVAGSVSVEAMIAQLERSPDWRAVLGRVTSAANGPADALEDAIELHRSLRLGVLPGYYDDGERRLVEALVMPLDAERLVAIMRRRQAGEAPEAIAASIIPGALLDARALARVARAPGPAAALGPLVERGLVGRDEAARLAAAELAGAGAAEVESRLWEAIERSRRARALGWGPDAETVRRLLDHERDERESVLLELQAGGAALATLLERATRLARLDALAARGPRDPLGIGAVIGYVSAVEAQAVRLRAILARVRGGWSAEDASPYLARTERPAWLASSS